MKIRIKPIIVAGSIFTVSSSCHTNSSGNNHSVDTSVEKQIDTSGQQMLPGTPGPSGTEPKPGDTTRAHNDSLKKARDLSDSSAHSGK